MVFKREDTPSEPLSLMPEPIKGLHKESRFDKIK